MPIGKKPGAIVDNSGGITMIQECTYAGALIGTTYLLIGYLEDGTGWSDKTPRNKKIDETGGVVKSTLGDREVMIEGSFMQSDKDLLDLLGDSCRDKYYSVYRYEGIVNEYHQEVFFGVCQIVPQIELKAGAKSIPFQIEVLKNSIAITIEIADLPSHAQTGADVVIASGAYYKVVETAVT